MFTHLGWRGDTSVRALLRVDLRRAGTQLEPSEQTVMHAGDEVMNAFEQLKGEGWIADGAMELKSGKEATVYRCAMGSRSVEVVMKGTGRHAGSDTPSRNHSDDGLNTAPFGPLCGTRYLAVKVFRSRAQRGFRNEQMYLAGRMHLARAGRVQRATTNGSAFGAEVAAGTWVDQEWTMLNRLSEAGLDVPRPIARVGEALVMEYLGNESGPALRLGDADVPRDQVESVVDRLLWNVEAILDLHCVHGDLSPFNVLWWGGRGVIIDLPQSVDPRLNPAAEMLFRRDVENVCAWGRRQGVERDGQRTGSDLWRRFREGEIG